jgi:hypothetical protein
VHLVTIGLEELTNNRKMMTKTVIRESKGEKCD